MSLPPSYALSLYAGDDESFTIRYKNDDGTPVDLTIYSALMQFKTDKCGAADLEVVGVIAAPTTGEIVFPITGAQKSALIVDCQNTCYSYDVQLTDPSLDKKTILRGIVTIVQDVTQ